MKKIIFSDEKIFTTEEYHNPQNVRVYAESRGELTDDQIQVTRSHHPASVMVFGGVSWWGKTKLVFVPKGVKISSQNYITDILKPVIKPLGTLQWTRLDLSAGLGASTHSQEDDRMVEE